MRYGRSISQDNRRHRRPAGPEAAPARPQAPLLLKLQAQGVLAAKGQEMTDHEFRAIKRAVLAQLPGRSTQSTSGTNVIVIGSAMNGEGRTTVAWNLALSMSLERNSEVVLIDGHARNPSISRTLGYDGGPGLLDVLRDDAASLRTVEVDSGIRGLSVVPAGVWDPEAPELLSSKRMVQLIRQMHEEPGRLFVFDSSPIVATVEGRSLADVAGQILFVIDSHTSRPVVRDALSLLPQETFVGLVLNRARRSPLSVGA